MTAEMLAMPRTPHVKRNGGFNLQKWGWLYMRISGVLLLTVVVMTATAPSVSRQKSSRRSGSASIGEAS